jgi:hypothetical protein
MTGFLCASDFLPNICLVFNNRWYHISVIILVFKCIYKTKSNLKMHILLLIYKLIII